MKSKLQMAYNKADIHCQSEVAVLRMSRVGKFNIAQHQHDQEQNGRIAVVTQC